MSRSEGTINAAIITKSRRLRIILELLKRADHPLSAEEISQQAYDFGSSGKIMLNISTNIGEMRSQENVDAGYVISMANKWKSDKYPWHDGRPRYWLISAPDWTPRWTVGAEGALRNGGWEKESGARFQETGTRSQETGSRSQEPGARSQETGVSQDPGTPCASATPRENAPRLCQYQLCNQPHEELGSFCSPACREAFFAHLRGR